MPIFTTILLNGQLFTMSGLPPPGGSRFRVSTSSATTMEAKHKNFQNNNTPQNTIFHAVVAHNNNNGNDSSSGSSIAVVTVPEAGFCLRTATCGGHQSMESKSSTVSGTFSINVPPSPGRSNSRTGTSHFFDVVVEVVSGKKHRHPAIPDTTLTPATLVASGSGEVEARVFSAKALLHLQGQQQQQMLPTTNTTTTNTNATNTTILAFEDIITRNAAAALGGGGNNNNNGNDNNNNIAGAIRGLANPSPSSSSIISCRVGAVSSLFPAPCTTHTSMKGGGGNEGGGANFYKYSLCLVFRGRRRRRRSRRTRRRRTNNTTSVHDFNPNYIRKRSNNNDSGRNNNTGSTIGSGGVQTLFNAAIANKRNRWRKPTSSSRSSPVVTGNSCAGETTTATAFSSVMRFFQTRTGRYFFQWARRGQQQSTTPASPMCYSPLLSLEAQIPYDTTNNSRNCNYCDSSGAISSNSTSGGRIKKGKAVEQPLTAQCETTITVRVGLK